MSIEQIQETIDGYYDKMVEAMCSGDGYRARIYRHYRLLGRTKGIFRVSFKLIK